MAKRVFQLAKELGVRSKDVLDKCRAEGLELKNHMAALSAGLEATIREWFSETADSAHAAVETAVAVDLETARKKATAQRRQRKKKAEPEVEVEQETPEAEPTTEAPPAEMPAPQVVVAVAEAEPIPAVGAPADEEPAPADEDQQVAMVAAAPEALPEGGAEEEQPPPEAAPPSEIPQEPVAEPIKPVGPQLVPTPAKLRGPQVVRVESPDHLPPPQRRQPRRPAEPATGGDVAPAARVSRVGGKVGTETTEADRGKKAKRRSPRHRGGRSAASGDVNRQWRERDLFERQERLAAATGGGLRRHRASVSQPGGRPGLRTGPCEVEEPITVKSLSAAMGVKSADIIRRLMAARTLANINQTISAEMAEMVAVDYGLELTVKHRKTLHQQLDERMAQREAGQPAPRQPVVTFLGHVDHGKTSLLDRIRSASVVTGESGGITQHVGAYRYEKDGRMVTFLDTPGHEAFTRMRARGANMTDVVVLVVAADDGVMPQTVEAISHARVAEVPIVVALNKIDVANANINRVMAQLAEQGLQPREWGGDTEVIQTSAETGDGIDDLVELLSLEAELLELTADPTAPASGVVVEAEMAPGRGPVARLLIQDGTLKLGDALLAGSACGRVRQLMDDRGANVEQAGPATPVEMSGLDSVPTAGDKVYVLQDIAEAKSIAEEIRAEQREDHLVTKQQVTLDNLFEQISAGQISELPLIIKADVQGSVEVLTDSLNKLSTEEVRVNIIHSAVGGVSTGDVLLADTAGAIIVGFHVVPDNAAREQAEALGVDVRLYSVIYELIDEIKLAMQGLLAPEVREDTLGHAEVRDVFKISRVGTVAGCLITDGNVQRNARIRITRDGIVVEEHRLLDSLKRFKDDVREVRNGMECGMRILGYDDIKVGDVLEAYRTVEVARQL